MASNTIDKEISALNVRKRLLVAASTVVKVNEFIIALCEDPEKQAKYKVDPQLVLKEAGIPEDIATIILAGNQYTLRQIAGGGEIISEGETVVVIVIVVVIVVAYPGERN